MTFRDVPFHSVAQTASITSEGADVLCDASGLRGNNLAPPQTIQQRRLPMIHVTHDGDHWRALHQH